MQITREERDWMRSIWMARGGRGDGILAWQSDRAKFTAGYYVCSKQLTKGNRNGGNETTAGKSSGDDSKGCNSAENQEMVEQYRGDDTIPAHGRVSVQETRADGRMLFGEPGGGEMLIWERTRYETRLP